MKNRIEISCESCKYFERHYAKFNGIFQKIGCGHCSNNVVSPAKRRKCPHAVKCKLWASVADNPQ